jgi:hypothetical protein
MIKNLCFGILLLISIQSFGGNPKDGNKAVNSISYAGKVLDDSNLEALTGASVRIVELDKTVYADFDGMFVFDQIPAGTYTLEVTYMSYGSYIQENVEILEPKENKRFLLSAI